MKRNIVLNQCSGAIIMGKPNIPDNVKYFTCALSANPSLFSEVHKLLEENCGEIEEVGHCHSWDFSPSYTRELGNNIKRCFYVFKDLQTPENLPDFKLATNDIERCFSVNPEVEEKRKVNIDPGYLNGLQVIVASTKRYGNRVYLRDGIYADLTLYYDGKTYSPATRLVLPDYRTRATIRFFNRVRREYLKQLKQVKQLRQSLPLHKKQMIEQQVNHCQV